ncbi:MAG: carbohydrate ABC transporter permease, partial [Pseudomonadota bacterium]
MARPSMADATISTSVERSTPAYRFPTAEVIKHAVLILGALVVLLPFYVMVSYSFKAPHEIM